MAQLTSRILDDYASRMDARTEPVMQQAHPESGWPRAKPGRNARSSGLSFWSEGWARELKAEDFAPREGAIRVMDSVQASRA
jgi:hypothetical protein